MGPDLLVTVSSGANERRLTEITPQAFTNYSTDPNPAVGFYQAGETYTLSSSGGIDTGSNNNDLFTSVSPR